MVWMLRRYASCDRFCDVGKNDYHQGITPYLLAGFLLAAYVNVPVFGVALAGLVIAALVFFKELKQQKEQVIVDDNEF